MTDKVYLAIDLKSFYASVECVERGLDPLRTNLVVADKSRTEKTICLAVSPSLKACGISGRARLFEVNEKVKAANSKRLCASGALGFTGESCNANELDSDPLLKLNYIAATPRMALYMRYSSRIYNIYLKYVAADDIHVYSIDEVFMDITAYLETSGLTAREFAMRMILDVLNSTGITATAGIGTNLYLCKIALDIEAKRADPDKNGVRIAYLDEMSYRRKMWDHVPLTDFWRIGAGTEKTLAENGIFTMGDIARCSIGKPEERHNEELLYKLFGVNAQLLIDHAWGWESCTIRNIKAYKPENNSISSGQVLQEPYDYDKTRLIIREMADMLALDLLDKGLTTDQLVLTVGYDVGNVAAAEKAKEYDGEIEFDRYGRKVPKQANGSINLKTSTSSACFITEAADRLAERILNKKLLVRRINISANHVCEEKAAEENVVTADDQLDMFTDYDGIAEREKAEKEKLEKEHRRQQTVLEIKKRYGKNAILRGMNLQEGATMIKRNGNIGGHKA